MSPKQHENMTLTEIEHALESACADIRHGWDDMLGGLKSPSLQPSYSGGGSRTSNDRREDNSHYDDDVDRTDVIISLRIEICDALASWCKVIVTDLAPYGVVPLRSDAKAMCRFIEDNARMMSGHVQAELAVDELRRYAEKVDRLLNPSRRETVLIGRCPVEDGP